MNLNTTTDTENLYIELVMSMRHEGGSLDNENNQKIIQQIIKQVGTFEEDILGLKCTGVYKKEREEGVLMFFESHDAYYFFDSITNFGDRNKLVMFGTKNQVTLKDVYSYIDDIIRFGDFKQDFYLSALYWLLNPTEQIRLDGRIFDVEDDGVTVTGDYGIDVHFCINEFLSETAQSMAHYCEFWGVPRTETGDLIVTEKLAS